MYEKITMPLWTVDDTLSEIVREDPETIFYSMNGLVASVLRTGRVVANGLGTAEIHVYRGGEKQTVKVEVTAGKDGATKTPFPVLITRNNGLPADYVPEDLVRIPKGTWSFSRTADIYMRRCCMDAYNDMAEHAASQGVVMRVTNSYRSYTDQLVALDRQTERVGYKRAHELGAPAGFSEHQLGLAIDLGGWIDESGVRVTENEEVYDWIENNCHLFGFMLKNPRGKEHITGGIYEPWHVRYIADLSIAAQVHDKAITLNEYLEDLVI